MRMLVSVVALLCVIFTVGCEHGDGKDGGGAGLEGTSWRLASWSAGSPDPSKYTITAAFSESQISGTSAVNSYGGSYSAKADGSFAVDELVSTEIAGSPDAMRAESTYMSLLQAARKYAVNDASLTLMDGSGRDLLVFHPP